MQSGTVIGNHTNIIAMSLHNISTAKMLTIQYRNRRYNSSNHKGDIFEYMGVREPCRPRCRHDYWGSKKPRASLTPRITTTD